MKYTIIMNALLCLLFFVFASCSDQSQTTTPLATDNHPSYVPTALTGVATQTATSASTATQTTTTSNISTTIIYFYQAIENKNYPRAYSYLSDDATTAGGQRLTKGVFLQMAQLGDAGGVVSSFDFIADSTNVTQIIVTLTRSSSLRYHAHLRMKEKGNIWEIAQLDRI
jgi:hypothetical protein